MKWTPPKWCTARQGDVTCQLKYDHDGNHRAETGEPKVVVDDEGRETQIAQVLSWA